MFMPSAGGGGSICVGVGAPSLSHVRRRSLLLASGMPLPSVTDGRYIPPTAPPTSGDSSPWWRAASPRGSHGHAAFLIGGVRCRPITGHLLVD
ncbi:hypothetical protein BDA96_03G194400 [Sorghum bicolor]|nr:hypothetical protein BDA96_03G194400 [Sorghum bicolor]